MKSRLLRTFLILLLLSFNIGCDQVSKNIARKELIEGIPKPYLNNHFFLIRGENKGAFLSTGDWLTGPARLIILSLIPLAAVLFGLWFVLSKPKLHMLTVIALVMIIGGGLANLYDRLMHGSVTDFMFIDFGTLHTGVFNVADMSIMAGMGVLLVQALTEKRGNEEQTEV
jgi:signal peptidase II